MVNFNRDLKEKLLAQPNRSETNSVIFSKLVIMLTYENLVMRGVFENPKVFIYGKERSLWNRFHKRSLPRILNATFRFTGLHTLNPTKNLTFSHYYFKIF